LLLFLNMYLLKVAKLLVFLVIVFLFSFENVFCCNKEKGATRQNTFSFPRPYVTMFFFAFWSTNT
jgi:hypothetical protein